MPSNSQVIPRAAVALMFFNRPELTRQVMAQIRAAKPPIVFLIQDGPRSNHPGDSELVDQARRYAEDIDWDCRVHRIYSDDNLGVRGRFLTGLDQVFSAVDRSIILEDDCLPAQSFFPFCDEVLDRYVEAAGVGMVSGNNFLRGTKVSGDSYFFSPDVRIWGWATWARVWHEFSRTESSRVWRETDLTRAISRLDSPTRRAAMRKMAGMLDRLDTWDVSFVLHCLDRGYLNVTPEVNLVRNIGFGGDSTHTAFHSFVDDVPAEDIAFPLRHPTTIDAHPQAGALEASAHRAMWLRFPLRHPVEFFRRAVGYLTQLISRRA